MDNIRGKTIAITGAARGIGYATAKALLARGARVVIGDRDVAFQESAVADLTKLGQVSGYPLDVTDRESFATFLDKARTDGGGHIDVLINNAGVMPIGPFLEQSEQAIRSSIEVNLYGVITGCQLALPDMIARRSGHIINIASLSGLIPVPGQVVYVGAKFGVVGLSAALADEVAPHGVDVSVIMPPFTNTELISGTKIRRRHQAGRARGHRGSGRQDPGQAENPCLRAHSAAFHRTGRADARPARPPVAQQATRPRHRVPDLRPHRSAGLRAARAGRSGRRGIVRSGSASIASIRVEELVGRQPLIVGGPDEDDVHELSVLGHVHPDRRHRFEALADLGTRRRIEPDDELLVGLVVVESPTALDDSGVEALQTLDELDAVGPSRPEPLRVSSSASRVARRLSRRALFASVFLDT